MYGLVRHSCPFHSSHELYTGQDERKGNKEIPWVKNSEEFLPCFAFLTFSWSVLSLFCGFFSFWLFYFCCFNDDMIVC